MSKLSIVIPMYNHWELTLQLLGDLLRTNKDYIDEILVVNDASTDDTVYEGLRFWKQEQILPIRELRLKENVGFLKASNKGMAKASGDILVLLSNDVRIWVNFCKILKDMYEVNGMTGLWGNRYYDRDTGWNTFNGKIYPYLEGWLLACSKETWKVLGGFDEQYAPCDFEDVDISTKAISLGLPLTSFGLDEGKIRHLGAQSLGYNPEREAITIRNKEKFRKKWINDK